MKTRLKGTQTDLLLQRLQYSDTAVWRGHLPLRSLMLETSEPCALLYSPILSTNGVLRRDPPVNGGRWANPCGLDDMLDSGRRCLGERGLESVEGEGMSGIEPCCELALEMLWLTLPLLVEGVSRRELPVECGESNPVRKEFLTAPFPLNCALGSLTRPNASLVIIFCSSASLRLRASSASCAFSASSSFLTRSSEESESSSESDGETGSSGVTFRCNGCCNVNVDEEMTFRGPESDPRELRRARSPRDPPRRDPPMPDAAPARLAVPLSRTGKS